MVQPSDILYKYIISIKYSIYQQKKIPSQNNPVSISRQKIWFVIIIEKGEHLRYKLSSPCCQISLFFFLYYCYKLQSLHVPINAILHAYFVVTFWVIFSYGFLKDATRSWYYLHGPQLISNGPYLGVTSLVLIF